MFDKTLFITGAGVSAASGIPTFRGEDGYWTVGSKNYTPQQMATRAMYQRHPRQFLLWYYHRFATYRHHGPNEVHRFLADKNLITQNIDGLDGKAGNTTYIAIHGRLDRVTQFYDQEDSVTIDEAPWDEVDESNLEQSLMSLFNIDQTPELYKSLKPFVLLFDEYYSDLYGISEAQQRMLDAERIIFMGTSFAVNITQMALEIANRFDIDIEVVDPNPVVLPMANVTYHRMKASDYVQKFG